MKTMPELILGELLGFLRAHFEKGNAPDLRSQLTSMSQLSKKSIHQFVISYLERQQNVILASKQSDDIKHDLNLIQYLNKTL